MTWGEVHLESGKVVWPSELEDAPTRIHDAALWWKQRLPAVLLVDEDGARGTPQWHVVPAFLHAGLEVRLIGGVQSMMQVQQVLDMGVKEVFVTGPGLTEPGWLAEVQLLFPGRVGAGVHVHPDATDVPEDVAESLRQAGVERVVLTTSGDVAAMASWKAALADFEIVHTGHGFVDASAAPDPGALEG